VVGEKYVDLVDSVHVSSVMTWVGNRKCRVWILPMRVRWTSGY